MKRNFHLSLEKQSTTGPNTANAPGPPKESLKVRIQTLRSDRPKYSFLSRFLDSHFSSHRNETTERLAESRRFLI